MSYTKEDYLAALKDIEDKVDDDNKLDFEIVAIAYNAALENMRERMEEQATHIASDSAITDMGSHYKSTLKSLESYVEKQKERPDEQPINTPRRTLDAFDIFLSALVCTLAFLVALLLLAQAANLDPFPDLLLESSFQPYHNIAGMINITRPVPKNLKYIVNHLDYKYFDIGKKIRSTELPDTSDIADAISANSERIQNLTSETRHFVHKSYFIPLEIRVECEFILSQVQSQSSLPWYSIENILPPTNAFRRQQWLEATAKSSQKVAKLAEDANSMRDKLLGIAKSTNGVVQRLVTTQWHHRQDVKQLKSRWYYRFNFFASPIKEVNCNNEIELMGTYLKQVLEVIDGLTVRRNILLDASRSLASLQSSERRDRYGLSIIFQFGRHYQKLAEHMLQHMAQALDSQLPVPRG